MSNKKNYLIVIAGPTAIGKTSLSIAIAQKFNCEIVSADSRQIYKEMSIGTAKPSSEELSAAPHHLINHISIHDPYSVGDYEREAIALLENQLFQTHNVAILTGGTGLYIKAVCEGLNEFPNVDPEVHQTLLKEYEDEGVLQLQEELKTADPQYFATADINNPHRLIRALGIIRTTGQTFSQYWNPRKTPRTFSPIFINLTMPREILYDRINARVGLMMDRGLVEEARSLFPHRELRSLQTVGYQELFAYFEGRYALDEAVNKIKQHSRNYAKRQMTWFRNQGKWYEGIPADIESIISLIEKQIN